MRSSVGGWVRKRLANCILRPVSGLMMYACACAGSTSIGTASAAGLDLRAAPGPAARRRRCSWAPERSASYSRLRLSAICRSPAAIGARIAIASTPMMLPPSRSRSPPPKMAPHMAMRATKVMPMRDAPRRPSR